MQASRLESGGDIDRSSSIEFFFDGRPLIGYPGDTLASALLANNVSMVARSIKYHRPRGILSAGLEEPNALVACADEAGNLIPNLKATEVWLQPGLKAHSQNNWPCLKIDVGALLQLLSRFLSAGFYYKTFMWPPSGWPRVYEKLIRQVAGHGRIVLGADKKCYDRRQARCDTLVVGAGSQGIVEALAASGRNESVLLVDQDSGVGGSSQWDLRPGDGGNQQQWLRQKLIQLEQASNIRCMTNTLAFGQYDHGLVLAVEQRKSGVHSIYWRIRAKRIIFATGSIEQPLIFPGNDRPGIMLAAATRQYIYRFAVKPGRRAFLAIIDPEDRAATAAALVHAGIEIVGELGEGEVISATKGRYRLKKVYVLSRHGQQKAYQCDLLCVSAGWTRNSDLSAQIGKDRFEVAGNSQDQAHGNGAWSFVDYQNDVQFSDIESAVHEGFSHVEHAKRYTTVGMGTDQGKTSWYGTVQALADLTGRQLGGISRTTMRPPYSPVSFGALAGANTDQHMVPVRRSPFHSVLEKFGCVFQTSGEWLYSRYFPVADESMSDAVRREVFGVRNAVGCVDMSTLGKVDVKGPDAIRFLSRVYCNDIENIQVGRLRYAIMLREDGMVFDDGTVSYLAENHYLITMTTANSASVWRWLNRLLQVHWPELDVQLTLVSDHYASLAIAGPNARALLGDMSPDFECNKGDFPFASVRTGWLDEKVSCRVFSLSYSGELSFEINVPARHAHWLYQRVIELGADYGVTPYGLEALDVLRIEKGHISVGAEIDGRTTPQDLGLANMVSTHKDFIGASLLQRPALKDTSRLQLVGLVPVDDARDIPTGAQLVDRKWCAGDVMNSIGRMTAVINSPTLGCSIGLALLERGHHCTRDTLWAASPIENRSTEVRVVDRCFYDPGGTRLRD